MGKLDLYLLLLRGGRGKGRGGKGNEKGKERRRDLPDRCQTVSYARLCSHISPFVAAHYCDVVVVSSARVHANSHKTSSEIINNTTLDDNLLDRSTLEPLSRRSLRAERKCVDTTDTVPVP